MTRHHELEVGLNACGVEVCPHASHRQLCAVASYLHRPGDEDEPQSRVGELYLYQLRPADDDDDRAESSPRDRWTFAPCATTRHTRAIFELKWAPATLARGDTAGNPALAQADAGGFVSVYEVSPSNPDDAADDDAAGPGSSSSFDVNEMVSVRCGGGGLGMATCVDWSPATGDFGGEYFGSCRLAVVAADGGARILAWRESGDLEVVDERECAHDLEAWAVAFAHPRSSLGSNDGGFIFTGADDAAFKGWDLRAGLDRSPPAFVNSRTHGAGVTCVAPSPHDPHVVATGSYDDKVRLWDCRRIHRPLEACDGVDCGGGTWRLRWHPEKRAIACAAMGGGVAIVDWSGREGGGAREIDEIDEANDEIDEANEAEAEAGGVESDVWDKWEPGSLSAAFRYGGHGSIAYGADWGWKRGGVTEDVVVSCSFYDKGLHVWSPR